MVNLSDFGFGSPDIPTEPPKVEKVIKEETEEPQFALKQKEAIDHHDPDKSKYNTEYILRLIQRDRYIFDLRGWPRGINRAEFDKLWDQGFEVDEKGFFWNSGHFSYAVREARRFFRADKEQIWKAIELNKQRQVTVLAGDWKKSALDNIKCAKGQKEPQDVEQWQKHARHSWTLYNQCLKELGLKEEPEPQEFTEIISCDPMSWGEVESKI